MSERNSSELYREAEGYILSVDQMVANTRNADDLVHSDYYEMAARLEHARNIFLVLGDRNYLKNRSL